MPNPIWHVTEAEVLPDYRMLLTFADGEKRVYDATPLLGKPIYAVLKEPSFFARARVACGTVVWSEDIDIAPEHLYENSVQYF